LYSFAPPGAATSISEPFFFPIKGSGERRGERYFPLLRVRFRLTYDLPHRLLVRVLVKKRDGRAEGDRLSGQLRDIDDFRARQLILQLNNARLIDEM
jgi:hypothetical protein